MAIGYISQLEGASPTEVRTPETFLNVFVSFFITVRYYMNKLRKQTCTCVLECTYIGNKILNKMFKLSQ